jgi:ribosomal-protein-alanine N-acetyltransferase
MTISFKSMEHTSSERLEQIMGIEKQAFGKGALSEYVIVPMLRYGKVYAAVDEDDEPIACAYFMRDINEIGNAYLMSVAVLPVFRGKDVGTELLKYAFTHLKRFGITNIRLTVDPANFNALSVYREKLGFIVVENSKDEYGEGEDRLVMEKPLQ